MPRLPELRAPVLKDLEAQLRFAPREALIRDIERAEALAADIDPAQAYPMEWVVFRITGYRPDKGDSAIRGDALLADLSALVERLCAGAAIGSASLRDGAFLSIEQLEERWQVSRSTINRHRKRGLVARRVRGDDGKERLAFSLVTVERHETLHARSLGAAAAYSRFDEDEADKMIRRAERYARAGLTLNEAAARIAGRYGRSHEGVRQLLRRQDSGGRIFDERGPLSVRERRLIQRAGTRAIEPRQIARRLGRSVEAVRRAIDDHRARVLIEIDRSGSLEVPPGSWSIAKDPSAIERVLQAPPAREGLGEPAGRDLLELVEAARAAPAIDEGRERARLLAYHALRARAALTIRELASSSPSAAAMDRAETDIRWAALLKCRMILTQMPRVIGAIESALDSPIDRLRAGDAIGALVEGVRSTGVTLDSHDPAGPLAAPLALALTSTLARRATSSPVKGLASPRLSPGVVLGAWEPIMAPRLYVLLPDERVVRGAAALGEDDRRLLQERFGLGGQAPSTLEELGARRSLQPMHVARRLRRGVRAALALARGAR